LTTPEETALQHRPGEETACRMLHPERSSARRATGPGRVNPVSRRFLGLLTLSGPGPAAIVCRRGGMRQGGSRPVGVYAVLRCGQRPNPAESLGDPASDAIAPRRPRLLRHWRPSWRTWTRRVAYRTESVPVEAMSGPACPIWPRRCPRRAPVWVPRLMWWNKPRARLAIRFLIAHRHEADDLPTRAHVRPCRLWSIAEPRRWRRRTRPVALVTVEQDPLVRPGETADNKGQQHDQPGRPGARPLPCGARLGFQPQGTRRDRRGSPVRWGCGAVRSAAGRTGR